MKKNYFLLFLSLMTLILLPLCYAEDVIKTIIPKGTRLVAVSYQYLDSKKALVADHYTIVDFNIMMDGSDMLSPSLQASLECLSYDPLSDNYIFKFSIENDINFISDKSYLNNHPEIKKSPKASLLGVKRADIFFDNGQKFIILKGKFNRNIRYYQGAPYKEIVPDHPPLPFLISPFHKRYLDLVLTATQNITIYIKPLKP